MSHQSLAERGASSTARLRLIRGRTRSTVDTNLLYYGDNLGILRDYIADDSVDLIYLDPPFFSNRNYEVIWGDEAEVRSFEDRWQGGIQVYVEWMRERVMEMHRILKRTGTIYLHCDWHAVHYLKVMMDDLFGRESFRNEIIWSYKYGGRSKQDFGRKHDTILRYTKSRSFTFNHDDVRVPHEPASLEANFRNVDEQGRRYRTGVWKSGKEYRYYADEGRSRDDVWIDIGSLHQADKERLGYPTQKPEKLLETIIKASSNAGDIVLDPFCGCGTTLVAAEKLGRQWIGIDISPTAVGLRRRRLRRFKEGNRDTHLTA